MSYKIYEHAYDLLPSPIFIADDEGRYVSINKAAERLLGLPRSQVIGKYIRDFVAPIREDNTSKLWSQFQEMGVQSGTFIISRPDGRDRTIRYAATTNFLPGYHVSVAIEV